VKPATTMMSCAGVVSPVALAGNRNDGGAAMFCPLSRVRLSTACGRHLRRRVAVWRKRTHPARLGAGLLSIAEMPLAP
jgi:hypothetical protein